MLPGSHTGEQVVPLLPPGLRHDSNGSSLLRRHSCTLGLFLGHFPTFSNVSAHHALLSGPSCSCQQGSVAARLTEDTSLKRDYFPICALWQTPCDH